MTKMPVRKLLLAGLLVTTLTSTSCEPTAILGQVANAVLALREQKLLFESFVRDVKRYFKPDSPIYLQAERDYTQARALYEGFLSAMRLAVLTETPDADLRTVAAEAEGAGAVFLSESTKGLMPASDTRRLPFSRAYQLPVELHRQICRLPKQSWETVLKRIQEEAQWTTWQEIE